MSEHLKYLGRRQELRQEKKSLDFHVQALIKNLREELNPLLPVEDLRPDAVAEWSAELANAKEKYGKIVAELKQISDIIGD